MKNSRRFLRAASWLFGAVVASPAHSDCGIDVLVWTTSDNLVGEIVTVSLIDPKTKKVAQSWQLEIAGNKPKEYSECAEAGEYIVRYSGLGMAWQEYHNLAINSRTVLRIRMKPGNDGRVLIVSEPYEIRGK